MYKYILETAGNINWMALFALLTFFFVFSMSIYLAFIKKEDELKEVAQLPLDSELVFLSCCKSGVGKLVEGEGMLSINRSFLSAGVSNIVFTLFKIYDSKTPLLTKHFYEAVLQQEKSYTEALQYAKQQMIAKDLPPKFWSGFLLLGE